MSAAAGQKAGQREMRILCQGDSMSWSRYLGIENLSHHEAEIEASYEAAKHYYRCQSSSGLAQKS